MKTKNRTCRIMATITWNEAISALETMVPSLHSWDDIDAEIVRLEAVTKLLKMKVAVRDVTKLRKDTPM